MIKIKIKNQLRRLWVGAPTETSEISKMKSGIAPLILIIIIGIVLAAGGLGLGLAWKAGLFGKPGGPTDGTTNGTPPPPQPPPSNGEEDPTKEWKVYTSSELGISVKYPKAWYILEYNDESPDVSGLYRLVSLSSFIERERPDYSPNLMEIRISYFLSDKPINDWYKEMKNEWLVNPEDEVTTSETSVDGQPAIRQVRKNPDLFPTLANETIYAAYKGVVWELEGVSDVSVAAELAQILDLVVGAIEFSK